jgi:hypothetical protein
MEQYETDVITTTPWRLRLFCKQIALIDIKLKVGSWVDQIGDVTREAGTIELYGYKRSEVGSKCVQNRGMAIVSDE